MGDFDKLSAPQIEAVKHLDTNLIVSAGAGSGKCIVGDSITFTNKGLIQIDNIPKFYNVNNTVCNTSILNYNMIGDRELNKTSNWFKFNIERTKKITTCKGFEEEGTYEHAILCINTFGNLFFKKFEDVCVGDIVLISKNNEIWNTDNSISPELSRLLGFLVADGYLNQKSGLISFSNTDKNVILEYYKLWKTLFNVTNIKQRQHPTKSSLGHDINSINLKRKFANEYGLKMCKSQFKEVPPLIMQSKNCAINFLQSYMDLKSYVDEKKGTIEICSASKKLLKQIQIILLNFNIISIRSIKKVKKYEHNTYYRLVISGHSLRTFKEKIGYYTNIENNKKLDVICKKVSNTNFETIPNISTQLLQFKNDFLNNHALYDKKNRTFNSMTIRDYTHFKKNISNYKLLKIISHFNHSEFDDNLKYLKNLAENFFFDRVENVKDSKNIVYDFTVPQNSCFVSNGFISHNTKMLTNKVAYLIKKGYDPRRILAITFTNKAANEVIERVCKITDIKKKEFPWVKTFHSACFKIIKNHTQLFGFKPPIAVHTPNYQIRDMMIALSNYGLEKDGLRSVADTMIGIVSNAKNNGNIREYLETVKVNDYDTDDIFKIYNIYNSVLRGQNAVDFDDILLMTMEAFKAHPELRNEYRNLFQYILIDEFQDSNDVQIEIVKMLENNGNLTVVGDDSQSVYSFRGANPSHFIKFETSFAPATLMKLEQNYRSTIPIVESSNIVISNNINQIKKKCFTNKNGEKITYRQFQISEREADWVSDKTLDYIRCGYKPDEIAVLYRTKAMSMIMEQKFRLKNIPYVTLGSIGFYDRREIADLNSYMFSIYNELDDAAFERIINVPKRGISEKGIQKLRKLTDNKISLQQKCKLLIESNNKEKVLTKPSFEKLKDLMIILDSNRGLAPKDAIENVIKDINYIEYLNDVEKDDKMKLKRKVNVDELVEVISMYGTVEEFFEGMSLIREDNDDPTEDKNVVRLLTIHSAKGLEWKVVFFVGVNDGMIPHKFSILESIEQNSTMPIEEERRCMYVAMTRAAEKLYLSSAKSHNTREYSPSRFLGELPSEYLIKELDNSYGMGYRTNGDSTYKKRQW